MSAGKAHGEGAERENRGTHVGGLGLFFLNERNGLQKCRLKRVAGGPEGVLRDIYTYVRGGERGGRRPEGVPRGGDVRSLLSPIPPVRWADVNPDVTDAMPKGAGIRASGFRRKSANWGPGHSSTGRGGWPSAYPRELGPPSRDGGQGLAKRLCQQGVSHGSDGIVEIAMVTWRA